MDEFEDPVDQQILRVSGMPVSFLMDLYPTLYTTRAEVEVPEGKIASPRSYQAAVSSGRKPEEGNSIYGTVTDTTGAGMPGVEITLRHLESGALRYAITDARGYYEVKL